MFCTWYATQTFNGLLLPSYASPLLRSSGRRCRYTNIPATAWTFAPCLLGTSVETGPWYHRIFRHGHRQFSSCINWDHRRTSQFSGERGGEGWSKGACSVILSAQPRPRIQDVQGCSGDFPCHLQRKPFLHSWNECAMKTTCHTLFVLTFSSIGGPG